MNRIENTFFASGSKGNDVRADGSGSTLARGWYYRSVDQKIVGPHTTEMKAVTEWAKNAVYR